VKLELTSTKINQLLERKELVFKIEEQSTPSRTEVRREIAVLMRTDVDNVIVKNINTVSGSRMLTGVAHVYNDATTVKKVEAEYLIKRNTSKKEDKPEEKPAQ